MKGYIIEKATGRIIFYGDVDLKVNSTTVKDRLDDLEIIKDSSRFLELEKTMKDQQDAAMSEAKANRPKQLTAEELGKLRKLLQQKV